MSIKRIDKNKYRIRVCGYYTDGSRRYVKETFNGTLREATLRESELNKEVGTRKIQKRDLTVKEFLNEEYLPLKMKNNAPKTYKSYKTFCENYLYEWFGNVKLKSLNGAMLDQAFSKVESGTAFKVYQCLRNALNIAVRYRYLNENPIDFMVSPPREKRGTRAVKRSYTVDEVALISQEIQGQPFEALWLVCVFGGLRPQEACALSVPSRNWDGIIHVEKAIGMGLDGSWELKTTKTVESNRYVHLGSSVAQRIIDITDNRIGPLSVYKNMRSTYPTPAWFAKAYKRFCAARELPYITVKDLRHTCATQMRAAGADFKDIQMVLGHTTLSTTLNNYIEPASSSTIAATQNWAAKIEDITRIKNKKNA